MIMITIIHFVTCDDPRKDRKPFGASLTSSVVLAMIGPAMRGSEAIWPLVNPTIVSLPIGFLGAVIGSLITTRDTENEKRFDAFLLQVHTGRAAE